MADTPKTPFDPRQIKLEVGERYTYSNDNGNCNLCEAVPGGWIYWREVWSLEPASPITVAGVFVPDSRAERK